MLLLTATHTTPGLPSLSMTVIILVLLGYPERARKRIREALTLAQQLSHPFSLSFALGSIAISYPFLQEDRMVQEQAEALIALASKHQFPLWSSIGTILHGWTLTEQGQEEGIVQLRLGLNDHRTTRAEAGRTYYLSLLTETYEKIGRRKRGLLWWLRCWIWCAKIKSASAKQSCIGSKAS